MRVTLVPTWCSTMQIHYVAQGQGDAMLDVDHVAVHGSPVHTSRPMYRRQAIIGSCTFLVNPGKIDHICYTPLITLLRRGHQKMPTTPLIPLPAGLDITSISASSEELHIRITSTSPSSPCPVCSTPSSAVHSYYRRKPLDLSCTGQPIRLLLSVRKFFCHVATCPRKIFTERLPELIQPSSRLTMRLRTLIQAMCAALNGQGGAQLGEQLGVHLSRMTFLRSLHLLPTPAVESVRVVGLDDFAWKRGTRYGTVILNLETHALIDVLPDREAESVKRWLEAHPEVELVSRDRAGAYADGAARGAPQAQQIADKWHLAKNLGDAVEDYVKRKRIQIPTASSPEPSCGVPTASVPQARQATQTIMPEKSQREGCGSQKQELWEQVHVLHTQGYGIRTIARLIGLARNTVRRYLKMEEGWYAASPPTRRSLLDPYRDYLLTRWMQGEHNGNQLIREIRTQGYQGCDTLAREVVTRMRKTYSDAAALPRKHPTLQAASPLPPLSPKSSPRQIRWLLAKKREELRDEEQTELSRLLEASEEVHCVYRLLQTFLLMIRERRAELLNAWMKEARASGIKELHSFVAGIERDYDAVKAGLSLEWSQGPVEGTVNKVKVHKRLMYGRASFALLRQKMLHCP
ncbi:MAG TPA: ISL3 family transposase [Ktedonobacter sp.]|nr:ISL3 family transposase [Ktedonobacter sp.]